MVTPHCRKLSCLDPAMPLYITAGVTDKLDPSDAEFVDVIHTNALVQGKLEQCGHVDFYMNGGIMQPGCLCPPTNFLVEAGENTRPTTKGMFLIQTNEQFPFAKGKWTDISAEISNTQPSLTQPLRRTQGPLLKAVDEWGKLEGNFNNKDHFSTPYSQDPYGTNWPYFNDNGPQEITQDLKSDEEDFTYPQRRPINSKFKSKLRKRPLNRNGNNRPVYRSTRIQMLTQMLANMRATAIGKENGQDEDRSASQCDMYYRCDPTNHEFGVGITVRGKTRFCVTRW
uniref:Lipase domain-containing protein n=1 Tax=Megaselia scalaris TaxID=36166 RepID=T1GW33_MEGSC